MHIHDQLDRKAKQKIQENHNHENIHALGQGRDIPIGCRGYGGNQEDICQKNISIQKMERRKNKKRMERKGIEGILTHF